MCECAGSFIWSIRPAEQPQSGYDTPRRSVASGGAQAVPKGFLRLRRAADCSESDQGRHRHAAQLD